MHISARSQTFSATQNAKDAMDDLTMNYPIPILSEELLSILSVLNAAGTSMSAKLDESHTPLNSNVVAALQFRAQALLRLTVANWRRQTWLQRA
jgi:hypothetical protein